MYYKVEKNCQLFHRKNMIYGTVNLIPGWLEDIK